MQRYEIEILNNLQEFVLCRLSSNGVLWRGLSDGVYMKVQDNGYWYVVVHKAGSLRRIKGKLYNETLNNALLKARKNW